MKGVVVDEFILLWEREIFSMTRFIDLLERSRSVKLAMLHIRSTKYTIAALVA
jgi:hypothetical protein